MRRYAWFGAVGVALFVCYFLQSRSYGVNSDAAAQALQAWDMLHGNVLLTGWSLSDVSFYTTELPEYMLVEAVRGLGPDVVHICAALSYTLLVLLAAIVGRGKATGREGLVRALLAGGIMVAPQLTPGTQVLLLQPDHTGTGVPLLLIFLLLDRLPQRPYLPVIVFVGLTWVQVADSMATYAAAVPIVVVCGGQLGVRLIRRQPGQRPWQVWAEGGWLDGCLALAAAASTLATPVALEVIHRIGGFWLHPVPESFAPLSAMPGHAWNLVKDVLILFGAGIFNAPAGLTMVFAVVHLVGFGLAVWAFCLALWRFLAIDRLERILLLGLLIVLAAGLFSTFMTGIGGTHEIAVVLPFAAVLAGRLLPVRLPATRPAVVAAAVVAACYLASLGYDAAQPAAYAQNQTLADWLEQHGLTSGLAGYWQADEVRLDSGGAIKLAPLGNGTRASTWESKSAWFDPNLTYANFVVTVSGPPDEAIKARPAEVIEMFGKPATIYRFGRYTIMVWHKNLLPILKAY